MEDFSKSNNEALEAFNEAQTRINELRQELGDLLTEINGADTISYIYHIVAEGDKNSVISSLVELVSCYAVRDENDERDIERQELEAAYKKAQSDARYYREAWIKLNATAEQLKKALAALASVITNE